MLASTLERDLTNVSTALGHSAKPVLCGATSDYTPGKSLTNVNIVEELSPNQQDYDRTLRLTDMTPYRVNRMNRCTIIYHSFILQSLTVVIF